MDFLLGLDLHMNPQTFGALGSIFEQPISRRSVCIQYCVGKPNLLIIMVPGVVTHKAYSEVESSRNNLPERLSTKNASRLTVSSQGTDTIGTWDPESQ